MKRKKKNQWHGGLLFYMLYYYMIYCYIQKKAINTADTKEDPTYRLWEFLSGKTNQGGREKKH